jgi:hypothetical protein
MGGFTHNHIDHNNRISNRVLKILARENLHRLSAPLADRIAEVWREFFREGTAGRGW